MIKTYNVLEMNIFYDIPENDIFLILSDEPKTKRARIKVWTGYYCDK